VEGWSFPDTHEIVCEYKHMIASMMVDIFDDEHCEIMDTGMDSDMIAYFSKTWVETLVIGLLPTLKNQTEHEQVVREQVQQKCWKDLLILKLSSAASHLGLEVCAELHTDLKSQGLAFGTSLRLVDIVLMQLIPSLEKQDVSQIRGKALTTLAKSMASNLAKDVINSMSGIASDTVLT
jgi:hypothetical protein